jgi:drug/metabolite transporter (DMT)-like permease
LATFATVCALAGVTIASNALAIGLLGGLFNATSLAFFYRAMALGLMSVASPLLACGSILAFGLAVSTGERPPALAFLGAPLAVVGLMLLSIQEHERGGARRRSLIYALIAPAALGFYLFLLGTASDEGGAVSAVLGARLGSLAILLVPALLIRPSFSIGAAPLAAMFALGLGATGTPLLIGYASDLGLISIVAILSSLYPIVTMLLAYVLLGERLRPAQFFGVVLALMGIILVSFS